MLRIKMKEEALIEKIPELDKRIDIKSCQVDKDGLRSYQKNMITCQLHNLNREQYSTSTMRVTSNFFVRSLMRSDSRHWKD